MGIETLVLLASLLVGQCATVEIGGCPGGQQTYCRVDEKTVELQPYGSVTYAVMCPEDYPKLKIPQVEPPIRCSNFNISDFDDPWICTEECGCNFWWLMFDEELQNIIGQARTESEPR